MPTLLSTGCSLGPDYSAKVIGYRLIDLFGTTIISFTVAGVTGTSIPGDYTVTGGISIPDGFYGRIIWGTDVEDLAQEWVGSNAAGQAISASQPNLAITGSRYGINPLDMLRAARNLSIGQGSAQRMTSLDAFHFIVEAENQIDQEISDFIAVPLKPTPSPGYRTVYSLPTRDNFPIEFTNAVVYEAVGKMLHSEFFEAEPNVSQSAEWASQEAKKYVSQFRSRATVNVGAGRRRHPNPHMPPNIAPKEQPDGQNTGFGMGGR